MNLAFQKIGLAVAFSPTSEAMLAEAARLTLLCRASLVLIHIGDHGPMEDQLMTDLLKKAGLQNSSTKICWEVGKPSDSILIC
jgi:hypothetical protein